MEIIGLDKVIEDIGSQSRLHFQDLILKREELLRFYTANNEAMREHIAANWNNLAGEKPFLVVENEGYRFSFRRRERDFNWIENYDLAHFRNSLVANILLGSDQGEMKARLDKVIYLSYYYRFMRKDDSIDNLTQNTCFELQEIIKQMIEKETTLYRNYPTAQTIDAVRWRLTSERLLLLAGGKPSSINLRKML